MEPSAREQVVLQRAVWMWDRGDAEGVAEIISWGPNLLPSYALLVGALAQLWAESPPPDSRGAADRLDVGGAPSLAQQLRDVAHVAREWDAEAYTAAVERLRVEWFLRDAVHETTLAGVFERARQVESRTPSDTLGLRRVWNMRELPEVPPPEYALEGLLLRPAVTIFGGEPGSRKTTFALAVALGAIHAAPVLGREMRVHGPALLLENDTPEGVFYGILRRLEWGMGLHERKPEHPVEYLHSQRLDLADQAWRRRFLAEVRRLQPAVTVIDSFSGAHGADEDKLLEMRPVLQCLLEARDITGGIVIVIDHVAKRRGERRKDARHQQEVRGTGSKADKADSIWIFSEQVDGSSKAECVKQRGGIKPDPVWFAPSDPAEGAPFALEAVSGKSVPGSREDVRAQEVKILGERILDTLYERPGLGKDEVWALIRGQRTLFYEAWDLLTALKKLRVEGKRGNQKWFVAEEA